MYESEQFEEICNNCLELRQLGITFPITSVSDAEPSSEFTAYLVKQSKPFPRIRWIFIDETI